MSWGWIIIGFIALVMIAAVGEAWFKRNRKIPLAQKFGIKLPARQVEEKPALGMEATDIALVKEAHNLNEYIEDTNILRVIEDPNILLTFSVGWILYWS